MPGRVYSSGSYRYGFNGKEIDSTTYGQGNEYDYGFRIYNPRIGKFLSVDPLVSKYSYYSPYQYAGGNPVAATDVDGKEPDWLTWKLIYWVVKAKIKGSDAGNTFVKNINTVGTTNNMGHFNSNDPATIQQQIDDTNLKTAEAKAAAYGSIATATKYATIGAASPFIVTAAAPVLPELFAVAGSSELTATGYLVQKTMLAAIDAGSQKLVTGKVDLADILSDYLPIKGVFGKTLLTAFQSSVDYTDGKFQTIFGSGNNSKSITDAVTEFVTSGAVDKLFGNFNKQLELAFEKKGLKGEKLNAAIGAVVKAEADFAETTLKVELSEQAKSTSEKGDKKK